MFAQLRKSWGSHSLVAFMGLIIGLLLSFAPQTQSTMSGLKKGAGGIKTATLETIVSNVDGLGVRELLFMEHPELIEAIQRGGAFGGLFSRAIATDIFGQSETAQSDAIDLSRIEEIAPRTWILYLPIVNVVLFETDEGLVLVDAGMKAAGPAIMKLIRSVSNAPIHTIIYTHGHVDHAYGTWALHEDSPQIIAHKGVPKRFDRYIKLRGSLSKYMTQPMESLPAKRDDLIYPTVLIETDKVLTIGGEEFHLRPRLGETDDQLYIWVPGRKAIASADYYQGFIPNTGNGNRMQRYPSEWAAALKEMASEDVHYLLPGHGVALTGADEIKANLNITADFLQMIIDQTISHLNTGMRKDLIPLSLTIPEHFVGHPVLNEQYVSPEDISKMVIKRYTGWWDDIPSHWSPASFDQRAREVLYLSGGVSRVIERARDLMPTDIVMASHLADWAWFAEPENAQVQALVIDVYGQRILHPESNTMEMLTYLNQMIEARKRQMGQRFTKEDSDQ